MGAFFRVSKAEFMTLQGTCIYGFAFYIQI